MFIDGRNVSLRMEECERRNIFLAAEKCRNWTIDNIRHTCTDFTLSTAVLYIKLLHLSSQQKIFVFSNERQCQNGQTHMPCTHSCLQSIEIYYCCYMYIAQYFYMGQGKGEGGCGRPMGRSEYLRVCVWGVQDGIWGVRVCWAQVDRAFRPKVSPCLMPSVANVDQSSLSSSSSSQSLARLLCQSLDLVKIFLLP